MPRFAAREGALQPSTSSVTRTARLGGDDGALSSTDIQKSRNDDGVERLGHAATGTARARRLTLGADVRPGETVSERDGGPIRWAAGPGPARRSPSRAAGSPRPGQRWGVPAAPGEGPTPPGSADADPIGPAAAHLGRDPRERPPPRHPQARHRDPPRRRAPSRCREVPRPDGAFPPAGTAPAPPRTARAIAEMCVLRASGAEKATGPSARPVRPQRAPTAESSRRHQVRDPRAGESAPSPRLRPAIPRTPAQGETKAWSCAAVLSAASQGRTTWNVAPCPGVLSTNIVPPCASTIRREM